jgi:hypothetical protein
MKISLLALASAVSAVPHYGAHSKFHSLKPSGGHGKPYPTGGWGGYNSTAVPAGPTAGTDAYGQDTTVDVTSTSTLTQYKTVVIKPSDAPTSEKKAVVENATPAAEGQCGPATVTVTASEKVTITVTPSHRLLFQLSQRATDTVPVLLLAHLLSPLFPRLRRPPRPLRTPTQPRHLRPLLPRLKDTQSTHLLHLSSSRLLLRPSSFLRLLRL